MRPTAVCGWETWQGPRPRWSSGSLPCTSCAYPMLDNLDAVPAPQRKALHVTFGIEAGPVPDRFLVGVAVLSLLGGGGGGTATRVSDRRRAVAGPCLGAGVSAFVGTPPGDGVGRVGVWGPYPER